MTSNQAEFIKKSIKNLEDSLLKGAGLIMLVLVFFLIRLNRNLLILTATLLAATLFLPIKFLYPVLLGMTAASFIITKMKPVLIVTSAIPISIIITFICMLALRLSLNFMTLFGLAL